MEALSWLREVLCLDLMLLALALKLQRPYDIRDCSVNQGDGPATISYAGKENLAAKNGEALKTPIRIKRSIIFNRF